MSPEHQTRFWSRVQKSDGCWLWNGSRLKAGYGTLQVGTEKWLAHRFAYSLLVGEIPAGLFVCHHCDEPRCVRPDHLFLGTPKDNIRDCIAKGRSRDRSDWTVCINGHSLTPENTRVDPKYGFRRCRICHNATSRATRKRNPQRHRDAVRRWRAENREKVRANKRASWLRHREANLARQRAWRERNKDSINARRRAAREVA